MKKTGFLKLWTLAVVAATSAFVLYLALRVKSVELGYELGRAHARVGRLREIKRVLDLELASHKTPERVDLVARTLLGMGEPSPDRVFFAGKRPEADPPTKVEETPEAQPSALPPAARTSATAPPVVVKAPAADDTFDPTEDDQE